MTLRIYVEGGGQSGSTKSDCRQAFRLLFEKVIPSGSFKVIASGGRGKAYEDFCTALKQHQQDYIILLVDSEAAVTDGPWQHLKNRVGDNWDRPNGASDDQAHLMVQAMEAWFLADRKSLANYYGDGFLGASLPGQQNVELIEKGNLFNILEHATQNTSKGRYHKTRHGFDVLPRLDPTRIRQASGQANRLFTVLEREKTKQ